jgi:NodT family efflux transporter outer membrane factor (OMF) lipoprotein
MMYFTMARPFQPMQRNTTDMRKRKSFHTFHRGVGIGLCAVISCAAGCMVGPTYHQPAGTTEPPPAAYKESTTQVKSGIGWKVARPEDAMLRGKWWTIFNDPELNSLEDQLTINNQNIKLYFENFMAARAIIAEAASQFYPTVTANASYTRSGGGSGGSSGAGRSGGSSGFVGSGGSGGSGGISSPVTAIMASLSATWEPDLWGKVRNAVRQAQYNAQISNADLENERLTEQASLAVYFFELRGQDSLEKLYSDTEAADKKALDYARAQFETGIGDQISVVEAENTLQNAQAAATNLGVARAQYAHAIAMLIGKNPSSFSMPVRLLKASPPPIPVGLPSQLLERRPDIAAAERAMASANAQIRVEYAAYFPALNLGAENGFDSSKFSNLLSAANHFWSAGPSISETIYDAGLRSATVKQYIATYNADLYSYRQTVLTAFQQVEDYLAAVRILSRQSIQQRQAEASAQKYLKLELARYETGVDPYVDVVIAQTTLLTDQQTVITLRVQEMTAAVQLIEALGGGWDRSQLPSPSEVSKALPKEETKIHH